MTPYSAAPASQQTRDLSKYEPGTAGAETAIIIALGFVWGLWRGLGTVVAGTSPQPRLTQIEARLDALEMALGRVEAGVGEQLGTQARAIESLQAMIARTDVLLERVLSSLEAKSESEE